MTSRQYKDICARLERLESILARLVEVQGVSAPAMSISAEVGTLDFVSKIQGAGSIDEQLALIDQWNERRQQRHGNN